VIHGFAVIGPQQGISKHCETVVSDITKALFTEITRNLYSLIRAPDHTKQMIRKGIKALQISASKTPHR